MQLRIQNGVVELSGNTILSSINFEINDTSKIAVVGRNGCGKTTLLKLISGEYTLSNREGDNSQFIISGKPKIGVLSQMTFEDESRTLIEEIRLAYAEILALKSRLEQAEAQMAVEQSEQNIKRYTTLLETFTNNGGFYFEREYESAIKKFGFTDEQKYRKLAEFSGGQRTKIAFLKLILSKPEILLLDEPTNHLDIEAIEWLEDYLKSYKKAFVVVSHDRMFLDNVVDTVYEIERGKTYKYIGNYSAFTLSKKLLREQQAKDYKAQQKEIERLNVLVERFRYKATKAAMVQSKIKQIERMDVVESPEAYDLRTFHADFQPKDPGVKDVLTVKNLQIGYTSVLSTVNLKVERGARIGIIGGNGLGKSTFIKTIIGLVPKISGECHFGARVDVGYFDQQLAERVGEETVLEDFLTSFPRLSDFEARSALGAFCFTGEDVFKTLNVLSGGEKVRLALCKIFKKQPNFLVLDEPTNHLDIVGKETLEDILEKYTGTLLFVSHDRYFVKKTSKSLLSFEKDAVTYYPYGYEEYLQKQREVTVVKVEERTVKAKKEYTTPLKERGRLEKAVKRAEERMNSLEGQLLSLRDEYYSDENASNYVRLTEIQAEIDRLEPELERTMEEYEELTEKLNNLE